ncbi:unnamed protein product [Amaranthus hypochondriacus]
MSATKNQSRNDAIFQSMFAPIRFDFYWADDVGASTLVDSSGHRGSDTRLHQVEGRTAAINPAGSRIQGAKSVLCEECGGEIVSGLSVYEPRRESAACLGSTWHFGYPVSRVPF